MQKNESIICFTKLELIQGDDMALILAAQMSKKPYPNSVFIIKKEDQLSLITEQIKKYWRMKLLKASLDFK